MTTNIIIYGVLFLILILLLVISKVLKKKFTLVTLSIIAVSLSIIGIIYFVIDGVKANWMGLTVCFIIVLSQLHNLRSLKNKS